jgi:hypothetical protein
MRCPGFQYSRIKGVLLLASAIALTPMIATDAAGIQMDVIPSVRLQEEWQSNVFTTSINEVSSFGTRLTPGLALKFTSVDNVILEVSGNYEKIWYNNAEAKNADSNTWFFRIDSTGAWKLTPTFSFRPSVYYVNTTNSYRRTQLVPSGDPVVSPVAIANYGNTKSQDFGGGMGFDYLATPNLTIGVSGKYSEQRFLGDNVAGSGLTNATQAGGAVSVSYLFSQRTSLGITAGGEHQTYKGNPDSDILSAGFLFGHQLSPAFRFDGTLEISNIRQSETSGIPAQKKTSPSGNLNIIYTRETVTAKAFGSYNYSGGSGFGEATRQWTTGLEFTNQFTREWSGNLSGAYQVSRSVFSSTVIDLATTYGTAGLRYQFLEWAAVDLTGTFNRQRSNGQVGETNNNQSALLGITIGKPYKIY